MQSQSLCHHHYYSITFVYIIWWLKKLSSIKSKACMNICMIMIKCERLGALWEYMVWNGVYGKCSLMKLYCAWRQFIIENVYVDISIDYDKERWANIYFSRVSLLPTIHSYNALMKRVTNLCGRCPVKTIYHDYFENIMFNSLCTVHTL